MRRWCLAAVLLLLTGTAHAQPTGWEVPDGFVLDTVATDLFLPVHLAFAAASEDPAAPLVYVTELYGRVQVVRRDSAVEVYADSLLNFEPTGNFPGSGELGVSGIAVDTTSGDLFVTMVYDDDGIKNRIVRMTSTADGLRSDTVVTLLDGIPGPVQSHQIHQATLGPDGLLYVQIGDGFVSQSAQDDDDLRGKILRLNLDGSIPADNPTSGSYVYAKGFRNPFGGAWRPEDDRLYISDNGPGSNDRLVRVEPGGNYGWPGSLLPGAIHLWNPTVAPTGVAFCSPTTYPPEYQGHLFAGLSGPTYLQGPTDRGKRIEMFTLDAQGAVLDVTEFAHYVGSGFATVVGLACGPDGLYFTDLYGEHGFDGEGRTQANLYRIRYDRTVAIEDTPASPTDLALTRIAPNPFTESVTLDATLPAGPWRFEVFDLLGRRVYRSEGQHHRAGSIRLRWEGDALNGTTVPNGLYLARLSSASATATARLTRLR